MTRSTVIITKAQGLVRYRIISLAVEQLSDQISQTEEWQSHFVYMYSYDTVTTCKVLHQNKRLYILIIHRGSKLSICLGTDWNNNLYIQIIHIP